MTLRHMKIFVSVFQNSSITKASRELHLAQPSVSFSVKELEEYYGIRLFERTGRQIVPTQAAEELYGYARHIVTLFEEMEKKMKNWDALGTLRIGASITIGTHIMPLLLKEFQTLFPKVTVEAVINNSSVIEKNILNSTIDLGLIENSPEHPDLISAPFMKDALYAIVPTAHPLAGEKQVSLEQLAAFPFLMRDKGSAGREILDACFSVRQLSVKPLWESSSTRAIVKGVSEGFGIAVLPCLLVKKDMEENVIAGIPLVPPLTRDFNIIYHKSKYLTPNMKALISLCEKLGQS